MDKIYNRIIEERIKRWEIENPKKVQKPEKKPHPVITISRQFGARGAAFAAYMGEKIGFKVWNREIVQSIADKLGSDPAFLESLDEKLTEPVEDLVAGLMSNPKSNYSYSHTLRGVVRTVEEHGNAIIVGRGANYICENPASLHIRVVEPLAKRITDYAAREGITKEEAKTVIQRVDGERKEFTQYHFKKDVNDPTAYDIVLNFGTFDLEDMMQIILKAYEKKTGISLDLME